jgi:hypothetical protein
VSLVARLILQKSARLDDRRWGKSGCRAQVEVKPPDKLSKVKLSRRSHLELWGASVWSRAMVLRLANLDVERFSMKAHHDPDWARSLRWAFAQYRRAFGRLTAESPRGVPAGTMPPGLASCTRPGVFTMLLTFRDSEPRRARLVVAIFYHHADEAAPKGQFQRPWY